VVREGGRRTRNNPRTCAIRSVTTPAVVQPLPPEVRWGAGEIVRSMRLGAAAGKGPND
jgi:hypothetical protein